MLKLLRERLANQPNDRGAVLALVLVMVIFISLLAASIGVFSQSSRLMIATNMSQSALRSSLVSNALEGALRDLSYKPGTSTERRWGLDMVCNTTPEANCIENTCKNSLLGPYDGISVQCFEKRESGIQRPLATFVLTGADCGSGSCETGKDMGLSFSNNNCSSNPQYTPMLISGGVLNSSGRWANVDNCTVKLIQTSDSFTRGITPQIIQPSTITCPTVSYQSYGATTDVARSNMCASDIAATNLDTTSATSQVRSYLDSVAGRISNASGTATTAKGDCTPSGAGADVTPYDTATYGSPVVLWQPGVLRSAQIALLNKQIKNCVNPIVLSPGSYRLIPDTNRSNGNACPTGQNNNTLSTDTECANTIYMTTASAKLIGGVPTDLGGATPGCNYDAGSTQIQFSGNSFLYMSVGRFAACSSYAPAIAAPIASSAVNFTRNLTGKIERGNNAEPFFELTGGSFAVNGLFFAPAGYAKITLAQANSVTFSKGAILKSMTLTLNASNTVPSQIDPPPLYNGDRVVQFRFYCSDGTCGLKSKYLGMVQLVIQDYFGRQPNSGYKILSWRTLW